MRKYPLFQLILDTVVEVLSQLHSQLKAVLSSPIPRDPTRDGDPFGVSAQSFLFFSNHGGDLARATSAIQYGGLLPLFDHLIIRKFESKQSSNGQK